MSVSRSRRRKKFAAGAAVALGAAITPDAAAALITVNSTADTVAADAQCTLREALLNANDDAATSPDCTAGSGADTISFNLTLPATITLSGTSLPILESATINGPDTGVLTINGNAASRIFTVEDDDSLVAIDVEINDLILTNGDATGEAIPAGGAIFNADNLVLTNVTVSGNVAQAGGGLVSMGYTAAVTITDSTFTLNEAGYGGAIFSTYGASLDISGSTFDQNSAYLFVGGIAQAGGDFEITDSSVTENSAPFTGGIALYYTGNTTIINTTISGNNATVGSNAGLYLYGPGGPVLIEDSIITGNDAAAAVGGLGIQHSESSVVIRDTEISGNTAGGVTGGLYLYDLSDVTIERLTLKDNSAATYQGGGALWDVVATISESQITGNTAGSVGGLYVAYGSYLYLVNSTIAENVATTGSVGGLGVDTAFAAIDVSTISGNEAPAGSAGNVFAYSAGLYIGNSIIADGTALVGPDLVTAASTVVINYSLVEDTTGASFTGANNLTGVDPQLGPLQNNGGPTETMKPASTSPVVNAGAPEYTTPPNDQRGFPRPVGIVDMGAVELNPGTLSLSSATYNTSEGATFVTITVNRTGGFDGPVSVNYTTTNGTATSGFDYATTSGTLNWADADASPKSFDVPILEDTTFEGSETFNVSLNTVVGATLGTANAVVTIADNEAQPTISIADTGVTEGNAGNTPATFNVTLSHPSTQTITVDFTPTGGTAAGAIDYQNTGGTVTFLPGDTSEPAVINVIGDTTDEPNETIEVTLSAPTNATLADALGIATITDDDPTPTVSIGDVTQVEGTGVPNTLFNFNVTLSGPSSQTVTVDFATAGVSATSGTDFLPNSGTVTFTPGDLSETIVVQVIADSLDEANETFTVTLSNVNANATILDNSGLGTITDDDGAPALSIGDVTLAEGTGGTTNFVFNVTLAPASGQTVTVDYTTQNGTAIAGSDYTATAGTLTFVAGDTSESITVPVAADAAFEPDENFTVVLSNAPLASFADDSATGTITNDDAVPTADLNVSKAIVGTGPFVTGPNATFTITVINNGPAAATNVHVLDTLPAGTSYVSAVPSAGSCTGTVTVDCNVGTLTSGGNATVTLTVQLTQPGNVSNTATANSDVTDPTPAAGTANITVSAPAQGDAIPTLSEWMLIALASALAAAAASKLRS